MKLMIIYSLAVSSLFFSCTNKLGKIISKSSRNIHAVPAKDEFIDSMNQRFPLIAGYGIIKGSKMSVNYIVGFSKSHCVAYRYEKLGNIATELKNIDNPPKTYRIDSMAIDRSIANKLKQFLYNEKFWRLHYNDVDVEDLLCRHIDTITRCNISDGPVFKTILAGNGRKIESKFYAPEFYETECCPGNRERKNFLKFKLFFDKHLPASLKNISPR